MGTSPPSLFEALRTQIDALVTMTDEEFDAGTKFFIPKKLRKRQYILQADDVCQWLVFVTRGCLRQYALDDQGRERIVRFGIEGWWMTDLASLQGHSPAPTNIDALEDSELLLIGDASLDELTGKVTAWDRYFREILEREYKAALGRISEFVGSSAEERYVRFLETYPDLFQRVPLHQIASYLGITPQTLSRIRRGLRKRP
jgi:CRP-like cAMP-binding protein